jgi:hypothetical protein
MGLHNSLLEAIYSRYTGNPDSQLAQCLGDRFYAMEAPQGESCPYAVFWIVSNTSGPQFDEICNVPSFEWQINCFSGDETEIENLADWCAELFSGIILSNGKNRFTCIREAMHGPLRKDDQSPWEMIITFFSA